MSKFVGVPADLYRDIVEHFERQEKLALRLKNAKVVSFSFGLDRNGSEPRSTEYMREQPTEVPGIIYKIGKGGWKYADVVAKLVPETKFSFAEMYGRVKPWISVKGRRPRDSMRVALDRDARFERIHGCQTLWFRRVDLDENNTPETADTASGAVGSTA